MKKLFLLFAALTILLESEEKGFSFYNGSLNFKPLHSNTFEPRVGLVWHNNDNRLRLDIGNSIDLVQYKLTDESRLITIGSDFFTYTLLRGEKNFHFPVDAVDYFFGVNVNYRDTLSLGIFTARLRLSHISAHFVDGHFDGTTGSWKDGLNPRVYSREFFDLATAIEPSQKLRFYVGILYLWHVDPTTLPRLQGYAGGELHEEIFRSWNVFGTFQYTITGIRPRNEVHVGTKIGDWHGRGTQVFFTYHYGNSIHGEYYDQKDEYSGIGFTIDF